MAGARKDDLMIVSRDGQDFRATVEKVQLPISEFPELPEPPEAPEAPEAPKFEPWDPVAAPVKHQWNAIAYGAGRFVVLPYNKTNEYIHSTDGVNWTVGTMPGEEYDWMCIAYGNGKFVAVSNQKDTNGVAVSTDGLNWTRHDCPTKAAWRAVNYGNGRWIASHQVCMNDPRQSVMYSDDGETWFMASAVDELTRNFELGHMWGCAAGNGKFVTVTDNVATDRAWISDDGSTNWRKIHSVDTQCDWWDVQFADGKFVAVGEAYKGVVAKVSTDGENWTESPAPDGADNNFESVAYGNGKWVAVAADGTDRSMVSKDGANWVMAVAAEMNDWRGVAFGDGKFVAISRNGTNQIMASNSKMDSTPLP